MAVAAMADKVWWDRRSFRGGPVEETAPTVGDVRRYLRGLLGDDHPCLYDVLQCATELVTNALKHTRSGSRRAALAWFTVHLEWDRAQVRIGVEDTGPLRNIPRLVRAAGTAESGRGLQIVDELATEWLISPSPSRLGHIVTAHFSAKETPDAP